jgi:hypothetical protein
MTVESQVNKVQAVGNSVATLFSFAPMRIFDTPDIEVTLLQISTGVETPLSEGTGPSAYAVVPASGSYPSAFGVTGSIQYPEDEVTPITSDFRLTMKRVLTLEQLTDLENQGGYFPDVQEAQFDKGVMLDLQQQEELDRVLKAPVSDPPTINMELPGAAARAGNFLGFDGDGDPIVALTVNQALVSSFWQGIIDDTSVDETKLTPGVMTTRGDTIRQGATAAERLALGTTGHVLQSDGTDVVYGQVTAAGIATSAVEEAKINDNAVTLAKMAHGTDGNLITYDATGAPAAVATGTAGQLLTSAGAGAAPTFQTLSAGPTFIEDSGTLSAVSTYQFDEIQEGTYNHWRVQIIDYSSTAGSFELRATFGDGGVEETASNYISAQIDKDSGTVAGVGTTAAFWDIHTFGATAATAVCRGWFDLWLDITGRPHIWCRISNDNGLDSWHTDGFWTGTAPTSLDEIIFTLSTGNFDGGSRLVLYGMPAWTHS